MHKKFIRYLNLAALIVFISALFPAQVVFAGPGQGGGFDIHAQVSTNDAVMTVEILDLPEYPPTTIAVGEQLTFRIRYSCGAVTGGDCDSFSIEVSLPDWFDTSSVVLDTGAPYAAFSTVTNGGILTLTLYDNNSTDGDAFRLDPGESETATISLPVRDDAYDFSENIPPAVDVEQVTTVTTSAANTEVVTPSTDIGLKSPEVNWSLDKVRVLPPLSVIPALDQPVVYRICLNSDDNIDNYVLNDFSFTDTIPTGAVVLSPSEGGEVSYSPTGTSTPNSVTWTFSGENISFRNGSVCRNITLRYPSTSFTMATVVDNRADSTLITISGQTCTTNCVDTDNETHGFGIEVATPAASKTILRNPVGLYGIGRWQLSLNTQLSNAPTDLLEFIDEMPVITGDYLPLLVTQIIPGGWTSISVGDSSIDVRANIETSDSTTCRTAPGGATWTLLPGSPFDGTAPTAITLTTSNTIRCMRTTFEQNDGSGWIPGAPMNFNVGSAFQILFEIRDPLGTGVAYTGTSLQNCMYTDSSVAGGPNDATIDSATSCATVDISGSDGNVSIDFSKNMPSSPEPGVNLTLALIIDLTERSSASLIDPMIADAIPDNLFIDTATDFWNITYSGDFTGDTILSEADIRGNVGGSGFSVASQSIDHDTNPATLDETRQVITFDLSSLSVAPPPLGTKRIQIDLFGQIRPFTESTDGPAPPYNNLGYFVINGPGDLVCEQTASTGNNGTVADSDDVFGFSPSVIEICRISRDYDVPRTARFAGQKWLRNENQPAAIVLAPGLSGVCEDASVVTDGQVTESNYTRNPCVHEGDVGDIFTYRLTVQNTGNISLFDYHLYDLLPYEGDTGVNLIGSPRGSFWRPIMTSGGVSFSDSGFMTGAPIGNTPLTAANFVFEYSDSRIPCRPEVEITTGCDTVTWSTDPVTDFGSWSDVESFRIVLNPGVAWEPGIQVEFLVELEIPPIEFYDTFNFTPAAGTTNPAAGVDSTQNPEVGHVAWNNFAHNFYETNNTPVIPGDLLSVAEPPRAGILVPEFGSIGNYVFFDNNNDRQFQSASGETGVGGVLVELYADTNGSGVFDAGDLLVNTTTTVNPQTTDIGANPGYYLFDNLAEGGYFVHLPASNFISSGPLYTYFSSTDTFPVLDSFINNIDHGVDNPDLTTNGLTSPMINIDYENEMIGDDAAGVKSSDFADGPYRRGNQYEENDSSDLTVDFGFYRPMSIGNRVWLDLDRALGSLGDGVRQAAELGIGGVTVQLYTDDGSGGLGALIAETITSGVGPGANNGYYLIDRYGSDQSAVGAQRIAAGDYIVHIPSSQFAAGAVLEGFINSDNGASAAGIDSGIDSTTGGGDENGVNATAGTSSTYPVNAGVSSTTIALRYDSEPTSATTELDYDPNRPANYNGENVEDDNGDLTVDFGFYQGVAIGNRVWFDDNRNGLIDINDDNPNVAGINPGIPAVTVYLYLDASADGVPDGPFIASDVTDADGYYIFDGTAAGDLLVPGNYLVGIDPSAGSNGTVLADMVNTITRVNGTPEDSPTDNDDNGIDRRDVAPLIPPIIFSETIVLSHFDEPTTEAASDKETGVGDGNNIQDTHSNLTVDFGYYVPMSIGNQVWFDTNNNALLESGEAGVNGVLVQLFRDSGSGIDLDNDLPYRESTTNANGVTSDGYYIFDDLPQGNYIIRLAPSNFIAGGVLIDGDGDPYSSSESGAPTESIYLLDNQSDDNDNGIDANFPQFDGIVSAIINLSYYQEPDGDTIPAADTNSAPDDTNLDEDGSAGAFGEGTFGERDDNAEMTIDFGVYSPIMSIGNRVFKDYDNNRILDGADVGVDGVVVNLFFDTDQNGIPDSGINNPFATTATANGGYYLFDGLNTNYYLVQIDEVNFRTTGNGTLRDYYSSQDKASATDVVGVPPTDNENDTLEDGIDNPFNPAKNPDPQAEGVFSPTIYLEPSNEPVTEADLGPEGNGEPNIQASNSDLTVDFGFYQPLSLGNHVWFDTNQDGLFNGAEAGIASVQVELYRETDGTASALNTAADTLVPVFDGTNYVNFDTTDANGFYLFDNLPPGQYWVHIPATEFGSGNVLFNHLSTTPNNVLNPTIAPAPDSDSNDNGTPDDATATTLGITSELITLGVIDPVNASGLYIPNNSEPVNEINKSNNPPTPASTYDGPVSIGRYGELDNNSDITIDFGFILADTASMSIGNRVWFDTNRNGLIDSAGDDNPLAPGNPGINGVTVLLYRADVRGNPIGPPIARDITANGGYYLFDVLDTDAATVGGDGDGLGGPVTPGNYVVTIPKSNFLVGGPLETYASTDTGIDNDGTLAPSTGVEAGYSAINDDNNDNGSLNSTYGVISNLITLTLQNERDDEDLANKEASVLDGTDASFNPIAFNNSDLTVDFGFYLPMSIGNFVWVDTNNNGVYDSATEYPVPDGVVLYLYQSDGVTSIPDPNFPAIDYQATTNNGFYLFDALPPGDYVVRLIQLNFMPGGLLEGYLGSDNGSTYEDDTDTDLNDNGRDIASPATTGGIPSGVITLAYNTEPLLEATSGNPADGPAGRGTNGELDANSNLTVDFGVYPTTYFTIGNRVWFDNGAGANRGNGVHDSDELGIANVIMYLFRDENDGAGGPPDGIPDSTIPLASTTTDVNGYYLFDSLASGNYIVSVAPNNFQAGGVLRGYSATLQTDQNESATDNLSDHVNISSDLSFGYYSATYTLGPAGSEPTGETDPTPAGAAQNPGVDPFGTPIPDDQSNLTVDFGFIRSMSLGNLVWFDIDNDGSYDIGTEIGIAGVTVELYLDEGNGAFDGTEPLINTDITDGNGFYLFNDLQPGNYFLHIPNNPNWNNGGGPTPLADFMSSGPDAPVPDRRDNNDNGIGTGDTNPAAGITSQLLTLAFGTAPTGESTLSNNPADGPAFRGTSNPTDNNSDLTWDFGFYLPQAMSIGNIVWIDDGNTTGTAGDGIRNGDELGVNRVVVELYADSNGDGNPDTTTALETAITANGGYYLFDGLPPGQYLVVIAESNFSSGVLNGYLSTLDGIPDNDDQDNGEDNPTPWSGGVKSDTIVLALGTEPIGEDEAVTGRGANGETDDNSNLTVDFGFIPAYDWGDAPDSYGTDFDSATTTIPVGDSNQVGPSHRIIANLHLGRLIDDETTGAPSVNADGDGSDEDGLSIPVFVAGTTVTVDITVYNNTGSAANLIAWFDFNGNGVFDVSEGYIANVPDGTDGIIQIDVSVPVDAQDLTGGATYARLRLTTQNITTSEPTGIKNNGEVEDYLIPISDVRLSINKTDGRNAIRAGEVNTYTITIENSGAERTGVRFYDEIPLATSTDANGYDPETITWTCTAANGASCIANAGAGTSSSGGPYPATANTVILDELIDLPRNGRIIYSISARVNENAGLVPLANTNPIINVAQLPNESPPLEDEDQTSIIFDPIYGIKVGTYRGFNIIRWTMAWYNPGPVQTNVTINDILPSNQQFPATTAGINLQCSGSIGSCSIVGDNRVVWTGTMLSSTPENDTNAVLIEFNSLVGGPGIYSNLATLSYSGLQVTAADSVRVTSDFSNLPETGFAPYVRTDLGKDQPVLYTQTGGITVEIPSLNVNIPIVGVPLVDGQWDVTWLGNQAGWLEGSAFPSWSGNSVLTSHVYDADGLPGPFIDLKELRYGDQVVIHVEEQTYTFEVQTNRILDPDDLSVFEHEEQAWITLVTCKDYDEITDTYGKRVVVRAVLVSVTR